MKCRIKNFYKGRIGIILPDPDPHSGPSNPDPYPVYFNQMRKLNYTFSRKFCFTVQNAESYDENDKLM